MYNILVADNYDLNWSIYHTINTINVQTINHIKIHDGQYELLAI